MAYVSGSEVKDLRRRLHAIVYATPFHDLASELIAEGWTENDVFEATQSIFDVPEPFKVKLQNAYRDILLTD